MHCSWPHVVHKRQPADELTLSLRTLLLIRRTPMRVMDWSALPVMLFMFDAMRSFQSRVVQKVPDGRCRQRCWVRLSGSLGQRRRVCAKSYCIMIHTGR